MQNRLYYGVTQVMEESLHIYIICVLHYIIKFKRPGIIIKPLTFEHIVEGKNSLKYLEE